MKITLNNLEGNNNLILLNDIPNILKVTDTSGGTKSSYTIEFKNNLQSVTTADTQWHFEFMGEIISNVLGVNNAVNRNFYVANNNASTAASVARAFRNCPKIATAFKIYNDGATVHLDAIEVGNVQQSSQITTNISSSYVDMGGVDGTAYSQLNGSKIDVDIFQGSNYITTLEKNWYNGEAAFDISPIITTFAEYGKTKPFRMAVSAIDSSGNYSLLTSGSTNYAAVGYMCNQGYDYLLNDMQFAQNVSRGSSKGSGFTNYSTLYVYEPRINVSFYRTVDANLVIVGVQLLDSAGYSITTATSAYTYDVTDDKLQDLEINLSSTALSSAFTQAFYVDVALVAYSGSTMLDVIKMRYNVIKPLKATGESQRLLFRNSYGGVSFIDMTGQKTIARSTENTTYQSSIYNYYDTDIRELDKVYDIKTKYTYTLKSHLMEEDGTYVFNDLMQSAYVWTEINGEKYLVIIDEVNVDEVENQDGVYQATVKLHMSQPTTLL